MKIKTSGMIRVGWTRPYLTAGNIVGTDQNSYSFDGHSVSTITLLYFDLSSLTVHVHLCLCLALILMTPAPRLFICSL